MSQAQPHHSSQVLGKSFRFIRSWNWRPLHTLDKQGATDKLGNACGNTTWHSKTAKHACLVEQQKKPPFFSRVMVSTISSAPSRNSQTWLRIRSPGHLLKLRVLSPPPSLSSVVYYVFKQISRWCQCSCQRPTEQKSKAKSSLGSSIEWSQSQGIWLHLLTFLWTAPSSQQGAGLFFTGLLSWHQVHFQHITSILASSSCLVQAPG